MLERAPRFPSEALDSLYRNRGEFGQSWPIVLDSRRPYEKPVISVCDERLFMLVLLFVSRVSSRSSRSGMIDQTAPPLALRFE